MLHKGADHTTIAMHDQPVRKPLSSSVNRVTSTSSGIDFAANAQAAADVGLVDVDR
jgi:hypothetical protein